MQQPNAHGNFPVQDGGPQHTICQHKVFIPMELVMETSTHGFLENFTQIFLVVDAKHILSKCKISTLME